MAKRTITVVDGQSVYDLAVQYYGANDGVKQLILDNPDKVNYYDRIAAGTELIIDDEKIIDKKVVAYFAGEEALPPASTYLNLNNWCLAYGVWNDGGVWLDSEIWFD